MDFKQYPSYKDSGVEWLGEVPEHWVGSKFKYIFQEKQHTKNMSLPFGAISFGSVVYKEDKANLTDELKENYQEVLQGEFLVNPLNLNYDLKSLRTALSKIDVVVSSGYFVLKLKNNTFNKRYLEYLLYIFDIRKMKTLGAGIRQTLTFKDMAVCDVAIPSACEQTQIVSFLDSETSRIDNLIAKQEKLIEKLEEHRKSVISHAVTKGLDPNAKMKDSGVEWLGEVPEHFDHIKIKQLAISKLTYGANESAEQEIKEHPRYIRITDIKNDGTLNPESFKSLPPEIAEQYLLANNDILFARSGATVGKTFKYSDSWGVCCFAGYLIKLSVNVKIANPDYVFYYLNSHPYWEYITSNQSQSTIQNVSAEKYANFTIAIPKIFEQEKIVSFLDSETSRIDNLIAKQEKLIKKLKNYRTSIISHAVTGKIDVRDLVA